MSGQKLARALAAVVVALLLVGVLPTGSAGAAANVANGGSFTCAESGGVLTWSDHAQNKYWVYRSTDNGASYSWIGRTLGATTFTDNSAAAGHLYQVHYQGIPRSNCETNPSAPPAGPFACEESGGVLTWSDHAQNKYWVYRSTDNGASYSWIGRTYGATTFTDNSAAAGHLYQVHYQGIPRSSCANLDAPTPGVPDALRITVGSTGSAEMDTSSPTTGLWQHGTRVYCPVSHFGYDDPVVKPGQPGGSHLHMFWGNSSTDATSTAASLLQNRRTSCEGGTNNASAYWVPALFNDQNEAMLPEHIFVYYKSFPQNENLPFDRTTIQPIPNGLKMIAAPDVPFGYAGVTRILADHEADTPMIVMHVEFPECIAVDGNGNPVLDSGDHKSHLAYSTTRDGNSNQCPDSHPYRIPGVSYHLRFDVPFDSDWRLASDGAGPKGHSLHGDYIAAWDDVTMQRVVQCQIELRSECQFRSSDGLLREQLPERFVGPDGVVLYRYSTELLESADRTPFGDTLGPMLTG